MAKSKSSASSATRKKHERKKQQQQQGDGADEDGHDANKPAQQQQRTGSKKKEKRNRFEPKVKRYVPPPPPPKGKPDPVDVYLHGGAAVDAELVVILRRLHKKDEATLVKGIDGLEGWIRDVISQELAARGGDDWKIETKVEQVVEAMQVWASHFPRLALHPERRVRHQAHSLHSMLVAKPSQHRPSSLLAQTRQALLAPMWTEQHDYVGSWCCSGFDSDKAVRAIAKRSWQAVTTPIDAAELSINLAEHAASILDFAAGNIFSQSLSSSDTGTDEHALVKSQSVLAIAYLLSTLPSPLPIPEESLELFVSDELWDLVKAEQPVHLRRAMYELLGAATARTEEHLVERNDGLQTIATRVLEHCWAEDEGWPGIIRFLQRYPQAWTFEELRTAPPSKASTENGDDNADAGEESASVSSLRAPSSGALQRLYQHLTLACSGHPHLYPTILLLLSTIPPAVLPPTFDAFSFLFESFWAAWGGRALSGITPSASSSAVLDFVNAFLECLLYELTALAKADDGGAEAARLAQNWFGRLYSTFLGLAGDSQRQHASIATRAAAVSQANFLAQLRDLESVWTVVEERSGQALSHDEALQALSVALVAFVENGSDAVVQRGQQLAANSVRAVANALMQDGAGDRVASRLEFLRATRRVCGPSSEAQTALESLARDHVSAMLQSPAIRDAAFPLLLDLLGEADSSSRASVWSSLFAPKLPMAVIKELVRAVKTGSIPPDLPSAGLDDRMTEIAGCVVSDDSTSFSAVELDVLMDLVVQPEPFIKDETVDSIITSVAHRLPVLTIRILSGLAINPYLLAAPCLILARYTSVGDNARLLSADVVVSVFETAVMLPELGIGVIDVPDEAIFGARHAWDQICKTADAQVAASVVARLNALLVDPHCVPSPVDIVNAAAILSTDLPVAKLTSLLPAVDAVESMLPASSSPSPALAVLQPLVSQTLGFVPRPADETDSAGLPPFARVLIALLEIAAREDHNWARSQTRWLPYLLLGAHAARDELALSSGTNGFFGASVRGDVLERLASAAEGLSAYILSAFGNTAPADWHLRAVTSVRSRDRTEPSDSIIAILCQLVDSARAPGAVYSQRAFKTVLGSMLRYTDSGVQDGERWLAWTQSLSNAPELACAALHAIKPVLVESPRLERYQNELAANVAGVSAREATSKGLPLLQLLLASAPPRDAPIIFLPQQRCIFLYKTLLAWISSDDDLDEELYSRLAELFVHLAPIIQDMSGSHWDLMFDVLELNIQAASWDEASTIPALYYSCQLLATLVDLAASNSDLRTTIKPRFEKGLQLVRDLFVARPDSRQRNAPRLAVLDVMSRLIKTLPSKMLTMDSFLPLALLLQDSSFRVQKTAFDLLVKIVETHIADLVVEAELDTDDTLQLALPVELVALISDKVDADAQAVETYSTTTTYLFAWLVTFRFFEMASPRIKAAYNDQLRRADIVATSLLPTIFTLVNLSDRTRPVDISPWAVDEFHHECLDELTHTTMPVFASHVYFRSLQAIPSLIRQWWEACKNRQLSMAFATFTARHFSPVLISAELAHLRDPNDPAGQALRDNDDFTVKVAAGANEVKAVFVVDEESMEIGIQLPAEFPLQQVQVKDVRKVGVNDAQWRAWLLGINQVITNQNGLIADALNVFKRNVVLHFEGVEACAICYSTVHLVDRSLPKKQCKTCSNRFHAALVLNNSSWLVAAVACAVAVGGARAQVPAQGGTNVADQACGWGYQCPDTAPCCTEFGTCSAGVGCLGGCNPIGSLSHEYCAPMPACTNANYTFADTSRIQMNLTAFNGDASAFDWTLDHQDNTDTSIVQNNELVLLMTQAGKGTRLSTTRTLLYGQIQASIKTTGAPGVVTAFITMSGSKDEIDWEWTSNNTNEVQASLSLVYTAWRFELTGASALQSNYYWMGDVDGYTHGGQHEAEDRDTQYHVYGLDWTPNKLEWTIDGNVVRTLQASNTKNGSLTKFPQTPSRIQMSVWPAGVEGTSQGTIDWAGGMIDWNAPDYKSQGYFASYVQWVSIQCYDNSDLTFQAGNTTTSPTNSTSGSNSTSRLVRRGDDERHWLTERADTISSYLWGANSSAGQPQVSGSDASTIINSQYSTGVNMIIKENDTKGVKSGTGSGDLATHAATTWWGKLPTAAKVGIGIGAAAGALFVIVSVCTCIVRCRRSGQKASYKQVGDPNAYPLKPQGGTAAAAATAAGQRRLAPQPSETSLASSMRKEYYDPHASPRHEYGQAQDAYSLPRQHSPAPQYDARPPQHRQNPPAGAQHYYGNNYARPQVPRGYSSDGGGGQQQAWAGDVGAPRMYSQQPYRGHY
ncbi:hypothetical protein OIV83_001938 [Microbotryomycetes sp. JL201]|nr:hypothetical protein OIV83_001938 [Microbotryomycetes sp. JL201]